MLESHTFYIEALPYLTFILWVFIYQTEDNYKNLVKSITDEISTVDAKTQSFKQQNARADNSILDLKCNVSEQQFQRDLEQEEQISEAARRRFVSGTVDYKIVSFQKP